MTRLMTFPPKSAALPFSCHILTVETEYGDFTHSIAFSGMHPGDEQQRIVGVELRELRVSPAARLHVTLASQRHGVGRIPHLHARAFIVYIYTRTRTPFTLRSLRYSTSKFTVRQVRQSSFLLRSNQQTWWEKKNPTAHNRPWTKSVYKNKMRTMR